MQLLACDVHARTSGNIAREMNEGLRPSHIVNPKFLD